MGISVALTPATTTVTVSKSMITNASFRTKKLPGMLELFLYYVVILDIFETLLHNRLVNDGGIILTCSQFSEIVLLFSLSFY